MTNRIHDAFERITAPGELKSSTLDYLHFQRLQRTARRKSRWGWAVACCCALLLGLAAGAYRFFTVPVSYVSVDLNPSIELALNRADRVTSVSAFNEDGILVLEGLPLKGTLYTEAIAILLNSPAMEPYLSNEPALTFTVAAGSGEKEAALIAGIQSSPEYGAYGGISYRADLSSIDEAHSCGLSFGKYAAYLVLSQYDESVTVADCHSMTMAELHQRIHTCRDGHNTAVQTPPPQEREEEYGTTSSSTVTGSGHHSDHHH